MEPMAFTDFKGRRWIVSITIGALKRLKEQKGVDLLDTENQENQTDPTMLRLFTDPLSVMDLIFCLVENQAKETNVSQDDFLDAMDGNALNEAQAALLSGLNHFFLSCGKPHLAKGMKKIQEAYGIIATQVEAKMDEELTPEMISNAIKEKLNGLTIGARFTNGLEPSASTPTP